MKTAPGDYIGQIVEHGTEERNSKALIWFSIGLCGRRDDAGAVLPYEQDELIFCRFYLEGGTEEKTQTAVRMARAGLKLCGFDPDARDLGDLDANPRLLAGHEVPVRVTEREDKGRFYTNYDISVPRSTVGASRAKSITSALRAAKSKDEPPMPDKPVAPPPGNGPSFAEMTPDQRKKALAPLPGEPGGGGAFEDIPFDRDPCF